MLLRLSHRIETALEPWLPEQRLFLKSDATTRFVRLRPLTQAISLAVGGLAVGWFLLASAILLMDFINHGFNHLNLLRIFFTKWIHHALIGSCSNHASSNA